MSSGPGGRSKRKVVTLTEQTAFHFPVKRKSVHPKCAGAPLLPSLGRIPPPSAPQIGTWAHPGRDFLFRCCRIDVSNVSGARNIIWAHFPALIRPSPYAYIPAPIYKSRDRHAPRPRGPHTFYMGGKYIFFVWMFCITTRISPESPHPGESKTALRVAIAPLVRSGARVEWR